MRKEAIIESRINFRSVGRTGVIKTVFFDIFFMLQIYKELAKKRQNLDK